jgi:hypothetical protein
MEEMPLPALLLTSAINSMVPGSQSLPETCPYWNLSSHFCCHPFIKQAVLSSLLQFWWDVNLCKSHSSLGGFCFSCMSGLCMYTLKSYYQVAVQAQCLVSLPPTEKKLLVLVALWRPSGLQIGYQKWKFSNVPIWLLCCTFIPLLNAWPILCTGSPMSLYPHWISCTWLIHLPLRWSRKFLCNGCTLTNYTVTYPGMACRASLPEIGRKTELNMWIIVLSGD